MSVYVSKSLGNGFRVGTPLRGRVSDPAFKRPKRPVSSVDAGLLLPSLVFGLSFAVGLFFPPVLLGILVSVFLFFRRAAAVRRANVEWGRMWGEWVTQELQTLGAQPGAVTADQWRRAHVNAQKLAADYTLEFAINK